MDKKIERRKKLSHLIKELARREMSDQRRVPAAVSDYIVNSYGLSNGKDTESISEDELSDVAAKIESLIEENYEPMNEVDLETPISDPIKNFMQACKEFDIAKRDLFQVTSNLISLLRKIPRFREEYSEHLKLKSVSKRNELEVLEKKMYFLKLQALLKLYDVDSYDAHLKLKDALVEKLDSLKLHHSELSGLDSKYRELKENESYMELLKMYKELLIHEKKIDYMNED